MLLKNWLQSLRSPFRKSERRGASSGKLRVPSVSAVRVEYLEERTLLTYLFVDYGDNFPGGTLSTTTGAFRDIADSAVNDDKILGVELDNSTNSFNAADALNIVAQTFTATTRDQMRAIVERAYLPLDVTVVELTSTPQNTADGRSVAAATSIADVVATLRGGLAAFKDAYIFVGTFIVDPGGANQQTYGPGGGGNSPSSPTLGVASDLATATNRHDDVGVVYSNGGFSNNTLNNISHEAGHLFGLRHSITNATNNSTTNLVHQAEIMSYRNTNNTTSSMFTRYPVVRGDNNSPASGVLVSYDDLAARTGDLTSYDQLQTDGDVGANPAFTFVSGTGAHDIISITRNGGIANVTVAAFADAAYSTAVTVPGVGGTVYSYSIPLTKDILVYGGDSNDRIVINGDLGVNVRIDGMLGTDNLVVDGNGASASYTPDSFLATGVDLVTSFDGRLNLGTTSIFITNFEAASSITIDDVSVVTINGSEDNDVLEVGLTLAGDPELTGTLGTTALIPLTMTNVGTIAVNGLLGNDTLTVNSSNGLIMVPNGIRFDGGLGFDRLDIRQTGGAAQTSETVHVGQTPGDGRDVIVGPGGTQTIFFENLEPVTTNVPAASFVITSLAGLSSLLQDANQINYQSSPLFGPTWGRVTVDNFEFIDFINKTNLSIDAGAGSDEISLNNSNTPTGLTSITVNGGDPTASDTLIIAGTGGVDNVAFTPTGSSSGSLTGLGVPINFATTEHVVYDGNDLAAVDVVTINGTLTNDTLTYDANSLKGNFRSFASPDFDTIRSARIVVNGGGSGADAVNILGSAGVDTVTSAANAITVNTTGSAAIITLGAGIDAVTLSTLGNNDNINLSGITVTSTVYAGDGNDTIIGSPQVDSIYGGAGNDILVGGAANDFLYGEEGNDIFGNLTPTPDGVADDAGADQAFGGDGSDNFVWEPGDGADVNNGGGDAGDIFRFFGSAAANVFTLRQGGTPTHFNALIGALVIDNHGIEDVIVDGQGGADTFTVEDLYATEVVSINLNLGAADAAAIDPVTVHGRSVADNLSVTSSGTGALSVQGLRYNVNLTNAEATDTLIINGNDGDDQVTVAAGAEAVLTMTLNGNNGDDRLTGNVAFMNGADGNDTLVGGAGNQTMDGGAGDDTFVGNGGSDNVGGGAGSSIGDTILVTGTGGSDVFNISLSATGQLLVNINGLVTTYANFLGGPIASSGIEQILVQGLAGNDGLTVNSTNGAVPILINFDGGNNADLLTLNGGTATSDTYSVGPNIDQGTSTIVIGGVTQIVRFNALEPVLDLVAGPLVVVATNANNAINYTQGSVAANGLVSIDGFETVEFSNKTTLTINALAGDDAINLNNPSTPTGLTTINVNSGDPTASDSVIVNGTAGNNAITIDQLTLDGGRISGLGPTVVVSTTEKLIVNGDGGVDTLTVQTPAGRQLVTVNPGSVVDRASIEMRNVAGLGGGRLLPIDYQNIGLDGAGAPQLSLTDPSGNRVDDLTINGGSTSDNFQVAANGNIDLDSASASITTQRLVIVSTGGISTLNMYGHDGDDDFFIPGNHPFTGGVFVDGGNPSASDTLNFTGAGAPVAMDFAANTVTETGFGPVVASGIEHINIDARGANLAVTATTGSDSLDVTPGNSAATIRSTKTTPDIVSAPVVNASNIGTLNVDLLGGNDTLTVHGTTAGEAITVTGALVTVGALETVNYTNAEALEIVAEQGADTITVTPGAIPIFVDGGDPIGSSPGDTLNILAGGMGVVFEAGPENDEGGFIVGANQRVSFDHIESLGVVGAAKAFISGTGGDDDITIIARDASTHAGTDGVQDFTTQVNAGPQILWTNTPVIIVDAQAGDDDIVMRVPAPNNANWNVTAWIFGGAPAAGPFSKGDRFVLETPQGSADNILFTPTGVDSGTIVIDEANTGAYVAATDTIIQLGNVPAMPAMPGLPVPDPGGIETFVYDGEAGNDFVTVFGAAGNDIFTHTPGTKPDEGTVLVNSLLAMDYTDLGVTGNIIINGLGGTDTLNVVGTNQNDIFGVAGGTATISHTLSSGQVRVPIRQLNLERVVIDGLDGADTFNIAGNSPSPTTVNGGSPDVGSDVINFTSTGATIFNLGASTIDDDGVNPPADVTYTGIETVNVIGAGFGLTTVGTVNDDLMDYTPQGPTSGRVQINSVAPVVNFSGVGSFTVSTLGAAGDVVVVYGTSNHDVISVNSPTRTVTVTNAVGTVLQPVILNNDVETVKIEAGLGNDTIVVVPGLPVGPNTPAPQTLPANLLIEVDGGPPGASDALVIASTVTGGTLAATDFVVHNRSRNASEGRIRVFRNTGAGGIIPLPDISYSDVEIVSPLVATNANPLIGPQLLQQGPDLFEQNESFQNAAYLGSGGTINAQNLAIFPDTNEHPFVPNDTDFFRVVAKDTGTLDFQIYFNTYNGLLPGGGDIDIRVLDSNGTVIAGPGSAAVNSIFGVANAANPTVTPAVAAGNNPDERIRIPVVAGQTYYLQVFNPANTRFNTNAYNLTITNTPAPVAYDLELNDALVNGAITALGGVIGANTTFTVPVALLNATPGFYIGKTIHFLTGTNAGLSLRIATQTAGGVLSVPTAGLRGAIAAGDGFSIESTDTGRSQNDNVTRDNTPLIIFRLDDDLLQKDLPGDPTGGPTPDQPTRISWNNTFTAVPGPSTGVAPATDPALFVAGSVPGQIAGYRVAIYEEGTTTTPGGPGPNGLWGYATMIAPGVYQFNFGNTTTNNLFGPAALTNGSHFLTARLEIIDPAAAPGPSNAKAPGVRSRSLEVFVDIAPPAVAFGNLVSIVDGLHPTSDSSVPGITGTISDRVTNDTTPKFWGTAEANSIVRAYLDVDGNGTVSGPDILLGQSVAIPTDGTNQAPFGEWQITSTVDLNSPVVLAALGSARDGLRRIIISAEDPAGNIGLPNGNATPQQTLSIFIDTQGPQINDPDGAGPLQAIQIANPAPQGAVNGVNNYNLFATKPANAAQGPTPLVNGLTINIRDLPVRVQPFVYAAIQNPATGGPIIAPLASVAPNAGAAAIAALAPIPIPAGAVALNPADFSVVGDANGNVTILSAYFVSTTPAIPPNVQATGYIVLTFRSANGGVSLPDDRFTLTVSDKLVDPASNRLDGENQGVSVPAGALTTPSGDGQPGGSFVARFTVDSRPEAAVFGQGGIFVDANGNWKFDPNNSDAANRDLTFNMGIDTDFIFSGKHSTAQTPATRTTNGFDKFGAYGKVGGAYRWLLDTTDNGVADTVVAQPTGFTVSGITFTGNGVPFTGNFAGAIGSADEIAIFDGVNWFLDTAAPFNVITSADTAFVGTMRGLPIAGDFDGDGRTDLATHLASGNRFQFDYASNGLTGNSDAVISYGFSGVLERPVAGDLNLDGITDIGLGVPNQDGLATNSTMSWYILQSVGAPAPGTNTNLNHAFSPVPLGSDLFQQFGNNIAVPLLGNFDPPPTTSSNAAPVLVTPKFVNTASSTLTTTIGISTTDANGDVVTNSASADSLAWYLNNSLGLKTNGNYYTNGGGRSEKWIQDANNKWYYITPTGGLYRWDLRAVKLPATKVTGTLVGILDPAFYANPKLLTDAVQNSVPVTVTATGNSVTVTRTSQLDQQYVVTVHATDGVASSSSVIMVETATKAAARLDAELGLSKQGNNYHQNWGGLNEKWVIGADKQWYFITPDGTVRVWDRSKLARGTVVAQLDRMFYQKPDMLVNASVIDLDYERGFKSNGNLSYNWGGQQEKWFRDKDNAWYFILPTGEVRKWDKKAGAHGDLVSKVDPSYYTTPTSIYKAVDDVFSDWVGLVD